MEKSFFVVTVKRGSKTKYGYGELLRDAIAAALVRPGEQFKYAKYVRKEVRQARFLRATQVGDYYVED